MHLAFESCTRHLAHMVIRDIRPTLRLVDPGAQIAAPLDKWRGEQAVNPQETICGLSAAMVWSLPTPPSFAFSAEEIPLHLSAVDGEERTRRKDIRGHSIALPLRHVTVHEGMRVTTPARTWLDCAALISPEHLLAMGDALYAKELAGEAELEEIVRWGARRRGIVSARELLPLLNGRAESPGESRLRFYIWKAGLPMPEVNPEIFVRGVFLARLDLAYRAARLAVEYDGDWHGYTVDDDEARRSRLRMAGWDVIVAYKEDLDEPAELLSKIRNQLASKTRATRRW